MHKYFMNLFNKIKKYNRIRYFSDGTYLIPKDRDLYVYFEPGRNIKIYIEMWMDGSRAVDDNFIWNNGIKLNEDEKKNNFWKNLSPIFQIIKSLAFTRDNRYLSSATSFLWTVIHLLLSVSALHNFGSHLPFFVDDLPNWEMTYQVGNLPTDFGK